MCIDTVLYQDGVNNTCTAIMYITAGNIMLDTAVSFLAMWVYLSYFTAAIKDFIILLAAELK